MSWGAFASPFKLDAFQLNAMELQSLQSQLKSAIQNHQIVLSKMRIDPQNTALQKQLHDLQADIMALSEKQKQVVQQLRSELEKKQGTAVLKLTHNAQVLPRAVQLSTGPVKLQGALKGGGTAAVLLPHLVVVPGGPAPRPQEAVLTPPIRVPQYPPTSCNQRNITTTVTTTSTVNNASSLPPPVVSRAPKSCVTVMLANNNGGGLGPALSTQSAKVPVVPTMTVTSRSHATTSNAASSTVAIPCRIVQLPPATTSPVPVPKVAKEDHRKLQLMSALGLMTREALRELQHRRGERKRRTTANPHFSSAALEEKRRNAQLLLGEGPQHRTRARGRPRLGSSAPSSPEGSSNETCATPNGHLSPVPACDAPIKREEGGRGLANGELPGDWKGMSDQVSSRSVALGWVSDYALLKSAKVDEKQKLLNRSLELKAERMQLEEKKQQLSEIIANQQKHRVELQQVVQNHQGALEKFEHVISLLKDTS